MNSNRKGKVGERELAAYLSDFGFEARRGQQFSGGADSPDVVCPDLSFLLHIECKRTERLNLYEAVEQAMNDARPGQHPVVFHRRNRKPWLAILPADDLLELLQLIKGNL